ncbi:MAG TPA: DUF4190 domain-containing protein [Tepidisphaeraceae bacterium]|nr:DUF4190 domain-containing protein [Tepidisphaeraceae bacterium]
MALFGRETEQDRQKAEAYATWVRERNPFAIVSIALGVFSFIEMGVIPIFSVAGLVMGIIALRQLKQPGNSHLHGRGLALAGIGLSSVAILTGASLYIHSYMIR